MNEIAKVLQKELDKTSKNSDMEYKVFSYKDTIKLAKLYQSYNGIPEFLYVPSKTEIHSNLISDDSCYYGAVTKSGDIAGVAKLEKLSLPSPFFVAPQYDQAKYGDFFGISGMLVAPQYRKKGIARTIVSKAINALPELDATGIYADCDFRNIASFATLSSFLNFVGYTDGRDGAEGEQTIYTTFYKSFGRDKQETRALYLDFSNQDMNNVNAQLQDEMSRISSVTSHSIAYGGGKNKLHLFDNKIITPKITLTLEKGKPIVLSRFDGFPGGRGGR